MYRFKKISCRSLKLKIPLKFIFSYMFPYLQFLLKSTNQHGVHSPFVYDYITRGLYRSSNLNVKPKSLLWQIKSINYFNKDTYFLNNTPNISEIKSTILESSLHAKIISATYNHQQQSSIKQCIENLNATQILLLTLPLYPKKFLEELRADDSITLVIDCYFGCLISKRTEQMKQNFYIRF